MGPAGSAFETEIFDDFSGTVNCFFLGPLGQLFSFQVRSWMKKEEKSGLMRWKHKNSLAKIEQSTARMKCRAISDGAVGEIKLPKDRSMRCIILWRNCAKWFISNGLGSTFSNVTSGSRSLGALWPFARAACVHRFFPVQVHQTYPTAYLGISHISPCSCCHFWGPSHVEAAPRGNGCGMTQKERAPIFGARFGTEAGHKLALLPAQNEVSRPGTQLTAVCCMSCPLWHVEWKQIRFSFAPVPGSLGPWHLCRHGVGWILWMAMALSPLFSLFVASTFWTLFLELQIFLMSWFKLRATGSSWT